MLKRLLITGLCVTGMYGCSSQKPVDTLKDSSDAKLVAYQISEEQENQIQKNDSELASFWESIDTAAYDYIHINGVANAVDASRDDQGYAMGAMQFDSANDATLNVKAAYGKKGVYLLLWAQDDDWVGTDIGPNDHETWRNDGFDLWWDEISASQIDSNHIWEKWLTYTSSQLQFWVNEPDTFLYNFNYFVPDGTNDKKDNEPDLSMNLRQDYATLEDKVGEGAFIKRYMDSDVKKAEVHIPWSAFGVESAPESGTAFAFTVGRTDLDSNSGVNEDGQVKWDQMSWRNSGHPWTNRSAVEIPWGDLYLGPDL